MKTDLPICIGALALIATLTTPSQLSAQQPHYKLIDLGTFGGPSSYVSGDSNGTSRVLNNGGALAGWADTTMPDPFPNFCFNDDCHVSHVFQWQEGVLTDLGALAEGLSSEANWISANGLIVGGAQNGEIDPQYPGLPETRAVLWRNRHITNLGTLPEGGYESWANAVNGAGQVVGWATNRVPDLYSMAAPNFLPTETRAFLWQHGAMQDLGTLGGTDALAQFINDRGQIVGYSYTSSAPSASSCPFPLSTGSFIWDKMHGMVNLGSFGGTCTIASAINNRGQVVGESNGVGDQSSPAFVWENGSFKPLGGSLGGDFSGAAAINDEGEAAGFAYLSNDLINGPYHAALWKHIGDLTDVGTVDGDLCSFASSINSKMQVVGSSSPDCSFGDASTVRPFLWDKGSIFDLNSLIPPGSSLYLRSAETINDRGEIAGIGLDGQAPHAFLLIPCDEQHPGLEGCDYSNVDASTIPKIAAPFRPQGATSRQARTGFPGGSNPQSSFGQHPGMWNQALRAQKSTSSLSSRPESSLPEEKCPGAAVDKGPDQLIDSPASALPGRCIEESGKLTGSCVTRVGVGPSGCFVKSGACQRGATAKRPGVLGCCGLIGCSKFTVDLATGCLP